MKVYETYTLSFEDFINEGKVTVKRKYTDNYPKKEVSSNAPVRERILSFVKEAGRISHEDLMEFIASMNEENGGATSRKWVNKNSHYFHITEKNGVKTYRLSALGERVHNAILKQVS
jgi:hypothetical protein